MRHPPGLGARRPELGLHRVERQPRQVTNRAQPEHFEAMLHLWLQHQQVAHRQRRQKRLRLAGGHDARAGRGARLGHARRNRRRELALGDANARPK